MKTFVIFQILSVVVLLVTASAGKCPYTGYTPGMEGVIVDVSFHPELQDWTQINGTWYKPIWIMEEGVRSMQRVYNWRVAYVLWNQTEEYGKWANKHITEIPTYDPYINITYPETFWERLINLILR